MIAVDRKSVRAPKILLGRSAPAVAALQRHFAQTVALKEQKVPPLDPEVLELLPLRQALHQLFGSRCAFCETRIDPNLRGAVARFRPPYRAEDLNRRIAPEHYWWLAYAWENLYLVCHDCQSQQGRRFPVFGTRAPRGAPVTGEKPLLLDPCADAPLEHLAYGTDGLLKGLDDRGLATIEVFGLNRVSLVQQRLEHIQGVQEMLDGLFKGKDLRRWEFEKFRAVLLADFDPRQPFPSLTEWFASYYFGFRRGERVSAGTTPRVSKLQVSSSIWVEEVEIRNFKALGHLKLRFPKQESRRQPWIMLVGENAVGKSSVLKAVALALVDAPTRRRLVKDARTCVRDGEEAGEVRITFNVPADPIVLRFTKDSPRFTVSGRPPRFALLGYGSTRLLPPQSASRVPERRPLSVRHLFRSYEALVDVERWLASKVRVKDRPFRILVSSLRKLLDLEEESSISRADGELKARVFGRPKPIRELSDGYQSAFALASNILFHLSSASLDMEGVEGTVLLDELEVHLHPRWKMRIVEALRDMFPRVRFIATTHDPLCLQGLMPGELHLLARDPGSHRVEMNQVDVPPGLRADQLLTGSWFGLGSTRDKDTLEKVNLHSALLAKPGKSKQDEARIRELEEILRGRLGRFNESSVESIALAAVAELRKDMPPELSPADRKKLKDLVAAQLAKAEQS